MESPFENTERGGREPLSSRHQSHVGTSGLSNVDRGKVRQKVDSADDDDDDECTVLVLMMAHRKWKETKQ